MVVVTEVENNVWGTVIKNKIKYEHKSVRPLRITMACLDHTSVEANTFVPLKIELGNSSLILCTLSIPHCLQQALDIEVNKGENVHIYLDTNASVHLSGYYMSDPDFDLKNESNTQTNEDLIEYFDGNKCGDAMCDEDHDDDYSDDEDEDDTELDFDEEDDDDVDDDELDEEQEEVMRQLAELHKNRKRKADEKEQPKEKSKKKAKSENTKALKKEESNDEDDEDALSGLDDEQETSEEEEDDLPAASKKKQTKLKNGKKDTSKKKEDSKDDEEDDDDDEEEELDERKSEAPKKKQPQKQQHQEQTKKIDGIEIKDTKVGHGPEAKKGKFIHVYYTGRLRSNGKVFDSCTQGKPFKFRLGAGQVIPGWDTGILGMKVGGKRILTIPPNKAYGNKKSGPIPANSTLVFDVELKSVS